MQRKFCLKNHGLLKFWGGILLVQNILKQEGGVQILAPTKLIAATTYLIGSSGTEWKR